MPSTSLRQPLRRLWAKEKLGYSLRAAIALSGVLLLCWSQGWMHSLIPLFLGVIASALAETDDSWQGRLTAVLVTLACFATATYAVECLFPYPWLFVIALAGSSFALTLLGALGERYATLAYATLILAVYSMIGVDQRSALPNGGNQAILLLAGAAWYGLLSVLWNALFAQQAVQHSLAKLFRELGQYLILKSALFEPLRQLDVEQRRLNLAKQNGRVVAALNAAKEIILHRVGHRRAGPKVSRYLKLYFLAQDIHERTSSSHYPYNDLAEAFFHSDVLFRCQRLLRSQGEDCQRLAQAIELRQSFEHRELSQQALSDLHASLEHLRIQSNPAWRHLLRSLRALTNNLRNLDLQLSSASNPDALAEEQDSSLYDRDPKSLRDVRKRIRSQLTPTSLLFRHALRLSLALTAGYGLLHWVNPSQGYWILLTTLFVCQVNYGATRRRLGQRITGTVMGLLIGWAVFDLVPNPLAQALLAVVAGVTFFALRSTRYSWATAAMTLLVLFCFNQTDNGYELFIPRLLDTLLGCLIAGLAVLLILPDWQGRRLNKLLASTLSCNSRYLQQIIEQYRYGKRDNLDYRLARRNAHNADATLSTALGNMLMEPGYFRKDTDLGFRFLVLSHTLLSYLSGLGAHRGESQLDDNAGFLLNSANQLADSLESIAQALNDEQPVPIHSETEQQLAQQLSELSDDMDDAQRQVQTQLALICRQLAPLRTLAAHLQKGKNTEQAGL
ncbi:YccS family putative transporter [Pseudomonas sp. 5P_3.1_Bac2]|uniref:YccS family putative transporter n=1 Tax=Pseudomonas sp. 5P_3.1_Bac2 TaxID=2971617 RepID=UPI0021C71C85|nr:YccS family putative transporter [Pseudomonas sp. 5P_3.1_Bac2]MCU1718415.1 YccS family putative transporter [Pseudomonas sp. 5P_3.1_Bac2]